MSHTETEIKFHISDLDTLAARLRELGAQLLTPRTHELNLRFDTPAGTLSAQACGLRLRLDSAPKLTYKGVSHGMDGIRSREEIEFTVGDFESAKRFLEALGYQVYATYEKYRTTYALDNLQIMLDEMPYGDFVEIEGENTAAIQTLAESLGLRWDQYAKKGYLGIFDQLRRKRKLDCEELTFAAFAGQKVDLGAISIFPADKP